MTTEIQLGKITFIDFELEDGRMCLSVSLSGPGWDVADSKRFWSTEVLPDTPHYNWTENDRSNAFAAMVRKVSDLLIASKKKRLKDLVGTPVEVKFQAGALQSWRVLEEVL